MFVLHLRNEFIGLEGKDVDQVVTPYDSAKQKQALKNALNSNCDKSQRVKEKFSEEFVSVIFLKWCFCINVNVQKRLNMSSFERIYPIVPVYTGLILHSEPLST